MLMGPFFSRVLTNCLLSQRKIETLERNHKAEQVLANEQIRKLKKLNHDLQEQLEVVTRNLQVSYHPQ